MYVINFIRGFLMALADSVPGVSGGTIAFIMGFYNKFISSLNALTSTKKTDVSKKDAIIFLLKLGIGWITGMVLSILFLELGISFLSFVSSVSELFSVSLSTNFTLAPHLLQNFIESDSLLPHLAQNFIKSPLNLLYQ